MIIKVKNKNRIQQQNDYCFKKLLLIKRVNLLKIVTDVLNQFTIQLIYNKKGGYQIINHLSGSIVSTTTLGRIRVAISLMS